MGGSLFFAFFTPAPHPTVCCSLVRHRAEFGSDFKNRASGSPSPASPLSRFLLSLRSSTHFAPRPAVSPNSEASSKQQGDGQRFQKKAMKTTNKKMEASAPASVRPTSVSKTSQTGAKAKGQLAPIDFEQRQTNRTLSTPKVLDLLIAKLPDVYGITEVVGKWVWVQFGEVPAVEIRRQLAELGFHWNNARQSWQHPCGTFRDTRAPYDPRQRYGSYFAADRKAA
jgi:hypothetical protein